VSRPLRIKWSKKANRDLDRVVGYLMERNPDSADRLVVEVFERVDLLVQHPELGAVAHDADPKGRVRHLVIGPFRVFYWLKEDRIEIVRFWDARQDPRTLSIGK